MKTKLGFIFLSVFFFTFFIWYVGYSSDTSNPRPDFCNNQDKKYPKRTVTDSEKLSADYDYPLAADAGGTAWKDINANLFKWHGAAFAENGDVNVKGRYTIGAYTGDLSIPVIIPDVDNIDGGVYNYMAKVNVVVSNLSAESFNNHNAITEVDNISAGTHMTGYPIDANIYGLNPLVLPTYLVCAHLEFSFDDTEDGDDGGAHNPAPSPSPSGASLSPSEGSYSASAGGTHSASLSAPSGFSSVSWYVASPSDTGLGTNVETDTGTGSTTSASFSWSVPSDASGDYVITAYTYLSDNTIVQPSYTVSVSSSSTSSTPSTPPSTSVTSTNTGSSSYGCDYNAEYDYCTDTGTCSERSGEFGIGMCGHRWCCCAPDTTTQTPAPSTPTSSTSVTSTNTGSSSYGCDYNAEYDYCTDTGTCSERSGEFGIGMCGHRWCCCAPAQ